MKYKGHAFILFLILSLFGSQSHAYFFNYPPLDTPRPWQPPVRDPVEYYAFSKPHPPA